MNAVFSFGCMDANVLDVEIYDQLDGCNYGWMAGKMDGC